jgi:hypothetical protein
MDDSPMVYEMADTSIRGADSGPEVDSASDDDAVSGL